MRPIIVLLFLTYVYNTVLKFYLGVIYELSTSLLGFFYFKSNYTEAIYLYMVGFVTCRPALTLEARDVRVCFRRTKYAFTIITTGA